MGFSTTYWQVCGTAADGIIEHVIDGTIATGNPAMEMISYSNVGNFISETHLIFGYNYFATGTNPERNQKAKFLHHASAYYKLITDAGDVIVNAPTNSGGNNVIT